MLKRYGIWISSGLVLLGIILIYLSTLGTLTLVVDGQAREVRVQAVTVGGALQSAGLTATSRDRIVPDANQLIWGVRAIRIDHSRPAWLWVGASQQALAVQTNERIPANILAQFGLKLFPGDRILWNGQFLNANQPLTGEAAFSLQFLPAVRIAILENGVERVLFSSQATLGQALWEAGIHVDPSDFISQGGQTPLATPLQVELRRSIPIAIELDGREIQSRTSAETVGQALAQVGYPLQGLDYSLPVDSAALPADGKIRVVRVREEVALQEKVLPFTKEFVADDQTELDQRSIVDPGQYGLEVTRVRVRYEDGKETARTQEAQWVASQPKPQKTGYGTKVVIHTLDTPGGKIEYWRAVTVYATSYSPCDQYPTTCSASTASGATLTKGIVATTRAWYNLMLGQRLYIPGYGNGVVADLGGGIAGTYWIDLGYGEDDYVPWHENVTIYFLTPVPDNISWILP